MKFKKLLSVMVLCSLALTACTTNEKTKILEDDVLIDEINYADKITKEKIDIKLEGDYSFEPGFFYEDKIYGIIRSRSDSDQPVYRGYYSENDGIVKLEEIDNVEAFSSISYKNRRVISQSLDCKTNSGYDNTMKIRDNGTGEIKKFPMVTTEANEIRISSTEALTPNYSIILVDMDVKDNEKVSFSDSTEMVVGSNNYGYQVITRKVFEGELPTPKFYGLKAINDGYKRQYNAMVLYDYDKHTTITYDGLYKSEDFPKVKKVMYAEDGKLYAIAGEYEDELYQIEIKDNKYTMELYYKFDLGERVTGIWNARIIGDSLMLDSYVPKENEKDGSFYVNDERSLLLSLKDKSLEEIAGVNNITTRLIQFNSNKYIIMENYDPKSQKGRVLLGRIDDNKIEYIYEFDEGPSYPIIDDENKRIFIAYFRDNGMEYYLYNLDID